MPKSKPVSTISISAIEKNQKLFELSPEAIILVDKKGLIVDANQRLKDWLGYSPKEIIGTKIPKLPFLSRKNKLFALSQFTKRMAGKNIPPYELEFINKDQSKRIGLVQAVPIKDKQGKNAIDLVMISDITQLKKAENQRMSDSKELERLNELMMGREHKMAQLKRELRDRQGKNQIGPLGLVSKLFFDPAKAMGNLRENSFLQMLVAAIAGIYASLIIILFTTVAPTTATVITSFTIFLGLVIAWTSSSMHVHLNLGGNKTKKAMLNLLEDISEEKAYEEVRGKSILENIGEGIIITNEKGLVEYINPAFEEFMGCLTTELEGKDFAETVKMFDLNGKEIPIIERSDSAAVTAKNQQMKVSIKCKGDKQMVVSLNAAPIKVNSQFKGVVRVIHDISKDFKLQQQKDDFFSIASHELRTPLTVIAGNIDMIIQGYGKSKLSKNDKLLLTDAGTATDRLISMVNEFLNVSRLDQGRLRTNIVELDSCKMTADVVKEIIPLAKEKKIELEYSCNKEHGNVMADENLLKEILINLIGNSIKFTKQGKIQVSHAIKKGMLITIVTDTGIGIAKDKQKGLFARFQQAMSRTMSREAGGTGLGLYISREFTRLMGGDLKLIFSEENKGSSFAFSLPLIKK